MKLTAKEIANIRESLAAGMQPTRAILEMVLDSHEEMLAELEDVESNTIDRPTNVLRRWW